MLIVSALSAPANGSVHRTRVTVFLSQGPELGFWLDLVHPAACPFLGVRRALLDHLERLERGGDAHTMERVRRLRGHMDALLCA
ncbi:MAG: hypothetical protein RL385_5058 [Pseudomonadota bacterium]|jgi:hypothetical protein